MSERLDMGVPPDPAVNGRATRSPLVLTRPRSATQARPERPQLRVTRRPSGTPPAPSTSPMPAADGGGSWGGSLARMLGRVVPKAGAIGELIASRLPAVAGRSRQDAALLQWAPLAIARALDGGTPDAEQAAQLPPPVLRPPVRLARSTSSAQATPPPDRAATGLDDGASFIDEAAASGALVSSGAGGSTSSVVFPPPPGEGDGTGGTSSAPPSGGVSTAPVTMAAPARDSIPPPTLHSQIDEIYESVVERLRREILVERERMGDLVGDLLR